MSKEMRTVSTSINDATLIAYFHRRLSDSEAEDVARQIASDGVVADRYRMLCDEIDGLRTALGVAETAPPRASIETMVRSAARKGSISGRDPYRLRLRTPIVWQALAASVLLAVGLAAGFGLSEWRAAVSDDEKALAAAALDAARIASRQAALEGAVSGDSVVDQADDRAWQVEVTPIRTYQNANGEFCREFIETWEIADRSTAEMGIACRHSDGIWHNIATLQPE